LHILLREQNSLSASLRAITLAHENTLRSVLALILHNQILTMRASTANGVATPGNLQLLRSNVEEEREKAGASRLAECARVMLHLCMRQPRCPWLTKLFRSGFWWCE